MVRFRVETIPMGNGLDVEEEKSFLNSAVEYFRSIGADMIIPATTNTIFRTYPDGADAAPYGSYVIDLTQPEETLWANLHSKHRNVVRNATKKGVEVRSGMEYLKTAHELVRDTLKRSNMGFISYEELEKLANGLGEHFKIFIAVHEGARAGMRHVSLQQLRGLLSVWRQYSRSSERGNESPSMGSDPRISAGRGQAL